MKKTNSLPAACSAALLVFFLSATVYAQCIEGNCQNGKGTMQFPGGSKYIGEWKNGQMNGKGEFLFSSGASYVGEWREDKLVDYTHLDTTQKNAEILADTGPNKATKKIDIEKRFLDKDFDPSIDLPAAASGPTKKSPPTD